MPTASLCHGKLRNPSRLYHHHGLRSPLMAHGFFVPREAPNPWTQIITTAYTYDADCGGLAPQVNATK
jgi:hypothetical protein